MFICGTLAIPGQTHLLRGRKENTCNYRDINNPATLRMSGNVFVVSADTNVLCISLSPTARVLGEDAFRSFYARGGTKRKTQRIHSGFLLVHFHPHHTILAQLGTKPKHQCVS